MESEPCIICCGQQSTYLFTHECFSVSSCKDCGMLSSNPTSGNAREARIRVDEHVEDENTRHDAYARYLSCLQTAGLRTGSVLIFGSPSDTVQFRDFLQSKGYSTTIAPYTELKDNLHESFGTAERYDGVLLIEALERSQDPNLLLTFANDCLTSNGVLMTVGVSLDSWSAKFFGRSWPGWRRENRHYFGLSTLQLILERNGFERIRSTQDCRLYTLSHILDRARAYPRTLLTNLIKSTCGLLPRALSDKQQVRISSSRVLMTAHKQAQSARPQLSIIMPVYNERATFVETLQLVLAKSVEGVANREIIIVESNSTDGTRDLVKAYESYPDVKVVYQDRPRGKGFAVRTGLEYASGDIVLIQDADTEYDVNDYDCLLQPVLNFQKPFVLGTRHKGDWKMRTFSDQPSVAFIFNMGQIFFTWLMNTLYGQKMTDPFTMYKVLRRECLYGLHFECNRFDFDHELVIKLLRKGYTPYEVPVNYNSRSYSEGKKVTVVVDPLLWIKANFKYRFISPFKSTLEADMLEVSKTLAQSESANQLVTTK